MQGRKAKENTHAQLRAEEGVFLALEMRHMAEDEYLGIKAENTRLKS